MEDHHKSSSDDEIHSVGEEEEEEPPEQPQGEGDTTDGDGGDDDDDNGDGRWAWGFLSDLQKAATSAAEEISRNAAEVAKTAANSINDLKKDVEDMQHPEEGYLDASNEEGESEDEDERQRKASLEKLENSNENTFLGQGIKNIDDSIENFALGAWRALGNAWKGGSSFIHQLEDSIQQRELPAAGSVAPSLIETGKAFSAKGMQVLEYVGKETIDLLTTETGKKKDKNAGGNSEEQDEMFEEVTFDRCFYIYGGPEQLEELEALSNHYALLFNRKKAKLSAELRNQYDVKLKQVQQIFSLDTSNDGDSEESEKGKKVENLGDSSDDEIKSFHRSSVSKAAEMAAGFANTIAGLSLIDIVKRTGGRLDSLHSEGVHRLSEMCCIVVSQLLFLGKSVVSNTNKTQVSDEDIVKIEWPNDCIEKAKIIRRKTQTMNGYMEDVSISFLTGISDIGEAYAAAAAIKGSNEDDQKSLIKEKVDLFSENLRVNQTTAIGRVKDGVQYLAYLVVSTSMPSAS